MMVFMNIFDRLKIDLKTKDEERLGMLESEHSNALERLVRNVHVQASKTKEQLYLLLVPPCWLLTK
jgi:hypothetical protein